MSALSPSRPQRRHGSAGSAQSPPVPETLCDSAQWEGSGREAGLAGTLEGAVAGESDPLCLCDTAPPPASTYAERGRLWQTPLASCPGPRGSYCFRAHHGLHLPVPVALPGGSAVRPPGGQDSSLRSPSPWEQPPTSEHLGRRVTLRTPGAPRGLAAPSTLPSPAPFPRPHLASQTAPST